MMASFFDDALSVLGQVAPGIATAIGGPVAGMAVKALTGALGLNDGASQEEVMKAVSGATPEQLLAIKEVEQSFLVQMRQLDIDVFKLAKEDRESARSMQVSTRSIVPPTIAILVFSGFFGILAVLMFVTIPEASVSPLNIMLGALATLVTQIAAFFFGSSAGSKSKTDILSKVK
jgi:hypothetical protein|tara:strand:- start:530 stop:1054 length:525 start_codon:yes stop_codon:yes gene_type:complete